MFYINFFGFFGFYRGWDMGKCLLSGSFVIFDFFNCKVGVSGDISVILVIRSLNINNDYNRLRVEMFEEFSDFEVGWVKMGISVVEFYRVFFGFWWYELFDLYEDNEDRFIVDFFEYFLYFFNII